MNTNPLDNKKPPVEAAKNFNNHIIAQDKLTVNPKSELYEAALNYAKAGFKIFPVIENGKAPLIEGGFTKATNDLEQVKEWWTKFPYANIGLPMALNGFIAIDIDRHGETDGFINLKRYCLGSDLPDLPTTVEATTANNGKHKIYKAPENFNPVAKLTEGVDIKYNGYIVVEPSKIEVKVNG